MPGQRGARVPIMTLSVSPLSMRDWQNVTLGIGTRWCLCSVELRALKRFSRRHSWPEGCLPFTVVSQLWECFREKCDLGHGARDSGGRAAEQQVLASWDVSVKWSRESKDGEGGGEGEMMDEASVGQAGHSQHIPA